MKLGLFFSRGISLQVWLESGLLEREKLIYEAHLNNKTLSKVYWFTYGINDFFLSNELKKKGKLHLNIEVIPMPCFFIGRLGILIYSLLLPFLHFSLLKPLHILKTNQMNGSWSAVIASWLIHRPLLLRTGYTWSLLRKRQNISKFKLTLIEIIENFAYKNAAAAIVTTENQRKNIVESYSIPKSNIYVIPNYIDTQLFVPENSKTKYKDRLIFIGRLNKEKNLFNLFEAIGKTNLTLDIYGKGELQPMLEQLSIDRGIKVSFMGAVPNSELPGILNRYKYYILPSHFEGMPKTLLEAMACGLVCIGTNVQGINEVIEDSLTGYLAKGTDSKSILEAINKAITNDDNEISKRAIKEIQENYSLDSIVKREMTIFKKLLH
ncbi:MAG: glycosyltransferase family 4 protein [Deltaproteobacteria bacterium]|nr:glycosyltransferase family 4 protein [Deltaproteobacteria bacterium]